MWNGATLQDETFMLSLIPLAGRTDYGEEDTGTSYVT